MRSHRRVSTHVRAEGLESRSLLSASPLEVVESGPNDTLDVAADLGLLEESQPVQVTGSIGHGSDVDWYSFTLTEASAVTLNISAGTVGLYNSAGFNFNDPYSPNGNRLLAQSSATGNTAGEIVRNLAAGTYFVAVSAAGNKYFHPLLADSGVAGATTNYTLDLDAVSLNLDPATPVALVSQATALIVRIDLNISDSFDPFGTALYDADGNFVDSIVTFDDAARELQFLPSRPLAAGTYTASFTSLSGATLDVTVHVSSTATEPVSGNDTPATAVELGQLGNAGLIQLAGVIGDDSYYDAANFDPGHAPGNDVDLYHFSITGPGKRGLKIEAFAGRIGSLLDVGISLFRRDPATGHLVFVAGNNNTSNPTQSTDGSSPLLFDSLLTVGLEAGDYYLAVSQGSNTPSPLEGLDPADPSMGLFDPEVAHSGLYGYGTGNYVLNLQLVELAPPPEVDSISITEGSTLSSPPTSFTVSFSGYINFTGLAFTAFQSTAQSSLNGVYFQDSFGQKFFPRLSQYDTSGLTATFLMLDRLPDGVYELHFSGALGITDLAGSALVGNSPGGDYVVHLTVATGAGGDPLVHDHDPLLDADGTPQHLGVLFPQELVAGVVIQREADASSTDVEDDYRFTVLQSQAYLFNLTGAGVGLGAQLQLFDSEGNLVSMSSLNGGTSLLGQLAPGLYTIHVGNWLAGDAPLVGYEIELKMLGAADNAPPLLSGPAPAVGLRLATVSLPAAPPPTLPPTVFPSPEPGLQSPGTPNPFVSIPALTAPVVTSRVVLPPGLDGVSTVVQAGFSGQQSLSIRLGNTVTSSSSTLTLSGLSALADDSIGRTGGDAILIDELDPEVDLEAATDESLLPEFTPEQTAEKEESDRDTSAKVQRAGAEPTTSEAQTGDLPLAGDVNAILDHVFAAFPAIGSERSTPRAEVAGQTETSESVRASAPESANPLLALGLGGLLVVSDWSGKLTKLFTQPGARQAFRPARKPAKAKRTV